MTCDHENKTKLYYLRKIKAVTIYKKLALGFFTSLIALVFLFPLIYTCINSFIGGTQSINIKSLTVSQYQSILAVNSWFFPFFKNSIILVIPIVVGQTIIALPTAYAFSRLRSKLFDTIFFIYVITLMMPFLVTLVPNYIIVEKLGLLTKYSSVILPGIFGAFGVFLLKQFIQHIPTEYIESAEMMGASQFIILIKVVVPLIKNGIMALVVLLFVDNWSMVEQPLIFLQDVEKFPLSIFLSNNEILVLDDVFAAAVLSMLPALLLILLCERYFSRGVSMSMLTRSKTN